MGNDETVEMIHVARPVHCACGEQLRVGERAGRLGVDPSPVCLWCLADLQAGRPRPRRRRSTIDWPDQLALLSPGASGAYASPSASPSASPGASPEPTWRGGAPSLHAVDGGRRTRRRAGGSGPRTLVSLLLTVGIVVGLLWGVPRLTGDDQSGRSITGITWGTHGIDFANPKPVAPGSVEGIRAMWPPVPADAKDEPLGRPPLSQSSSTDYAFMRQMGGPSSPPVSWDPCRPIHLVVNSAEAPAHADRLLAEAASEVSRATGLQFVIEGATDEPPTSDRGPVDPARYGNRWSPALIAWTNPAVVPELAGRVAGIGGPRAATYAQSVDQHWVSGIVFLDGPAFHSILGRSDGWSQARAIVMHELSHLVGLTHVHNSGELMNSDNVGRTTFGAGDLEGLRRLGIGRCFTK